MTEEITLYSFGTRDRSGKVRWLAHELGLQVLDERVGLGEHRRPPYTDQNPLSQIPTALFRGETLIESTAICHFIAEAFDEPKLWIGPGEPRRREYLFWLAAFGEGLEGRLVECILSAPKLVDPRFIELHSPRVRSKLDVLVGMLPSEGYLCGGFTVADIVAGYSLRLASAMGMVEGDRVAGYMDRLRARPAATSSSFFEG